MVSFISGNGSGWRSSTQIFCSTRQCQRWGRFFKSNESNQLSTTIQGNLNSLLSQTGFEKRIQKEMEEKDIPGAAVCIIKGDEIFLKGFGKANLNSNQPVTTKTLFNIASVSKSFTALLLTQMAAEGILELDKPIGNYFPGLHPRLSKVTTVQLLTHSAGLADYVSLHESLHPDQNWPVTFCRLLPDSYLFWPPGDMFSYSTPGYVIAAGLASHLAARPFPELMKEKVFKKVGMLSTTFFPSQADSGNCAIGYGEVRENGKRDTFPPEEELAYWGGTGIFTSVKDLARYANLFLHQGKNPEGKKDFLYTSYRFVDSCPRSHAT